jgi:hypothetical protein
VFQDEIQTEVQAASVMAKFVEKVSSMNDEKIETFVGEMRKSGRLPAGVFNM